MVYSDPYAKLYGNSKQGNSSSGSTYSSGRSDGPINDVSDLGGSGPKDIEAPIDIAPGQIGQSVTEGSRFGNFLQSATGAIRAGASRIELQTQMGGQGESVGAESYGTEVRTALRELAKANEVVLTSVHAPTQVGNLSGLAQDGFREEQRKMAVDEIKKAIDFAADVTEGGSITFHTGEFQRPISEQKWARFLDEKGDPIKDEQGHYKYQFLGYQEEPGRATTYMVDDRTGRIISDIRKSNIIRQPIYKRAEVETDGVDVDGKSHHIKKGDLLSIEGKYIDPTNPDHLFHRVAQWNDKFKRFDSEKLTWDEIEKRTDEYNKAEKQKILAKYGRLPEDYQEKKPEEIAYRIQIETQIMQYRGSSLYHGRSYKEEDDSRIALMEALKYYEDLEKSLPPEDVWKIMKEDPKVKSYHGNIARQFVGSDMKKPTELIKEAIHAIGQQMQYTHEASASADAQADQLQDTLRHVKSIDHYGKEQSFRSLAESGIYAMSMTKEKKLDKDIYLSPENIFPEMGYGSHPEELVEYVEGARKKMIELLTQKEVLDPHKRLHLVKNEKGEEVEDYVKVENPYYMPGMSKHDAEEYANKHIKANLDTQHLGMWAKNFQPLFMKEKGRMETPEETNKRFDKWYMDQIQMLSKKGVLGEIHIVDGFHTGGHTHLPAGQGDLPVVNAVQYLKQHGFKGVLVSEGHGEEGISPGRILTKAWQAFGSPLHPTGYFDGGAGGPGATVRFGDVEHSYFRKKQAPYFVFGGYSPSNDWTLWSEVPLE